MKFIFSIMIGLILGILASMLINSIFGAHSLTSSVVKLLLGIGLLIFVAVYFKE